MKIFCRLGTGNRESQLMNALKHLIKLKDKGLCEKLSLFERVYSKKSWSSPDGLIEIFKEEMKTIDCSAYKFHRQKFDHFWHGFQKQ